MEDLEDLGQSELDKALDESETSEETKKEADTSATEDTDTKPEEKESDDATTQGDPGGEEDKKDSEEGESDNSDETDPEKDSEEEESEESEEDEKKDPLKETQRAFHSAREELKNTQAENETLKSELIRIKAEQQLGDFKKLNEQELEELKYDDPDKYIEYREREREFESKQQEIAQTEESTKSETAMKSTYLNMLDAVTQIAGIDLNGVENLFDSKQLPAEFMSFLASEEMQKADAYLTANTKMKDDGTYSARQIMDAYRIANFDKVMAENRAKAGSSLKSSIEKAANGRSVLDKPGKADGPAAVLPKINKMSMEELDDLGEKEAAAILEKLNKEAD